MPVSLFRNVISKLGNRVQNTAEAVTQVVGGTVTNTIDAAIQSKIGNAVGEAWQKTLSGVSPSAGFDNQTAWSPKDFEKHIKNKLKQGVVKHPFFQKLLSGQLTVPQLQGWLSNEFYFQVNLSLKDAAILSNCEDIDFRRGWTKRLLDQDGEDSKSGAIEHWCRLAESQGLQREHLLDFSQVTPGVRFAVDSYLNFARRAPWQEAVCASLSESISAEYWKILLESLSTHYGKPDSKAVDFFTHKAATAKRDFDLGLAAVIEYFANREDQDYALDIIQFKLDILWTCLDTLNLALAGQESTLTQEPAKKAKGATPKRSQKKQSVEDKGKRGEKAVSVSRKKPSLQPLQAESPEPSANAASASAEVIKPDQVF
jgi:pyrroloquinoline-quinone synthase